jgi:hypothetical protein
MLGHGLQGRTLGRIQLFGDEVPAGIMGVDVSIVLLPSYENFVNPSLWTHCLLASNSI